MKPSHVASVMALFFATAARAQPAPDYDFAWATVGAPGNADVTPEEAPLLFDFPEFEEPMPIGGVGYEYRISRHEVTVGQWFEFVQAYAPHYQGNRLDSAFTSWWISPTSLDPNEPAGFQMNPAAANYPVGISWRHAARYCNWLHNGKGTDQASFENGAYDTSTFGVDGMMLTDQAEHSPDAQFWIPTLDEWTKAMHYDPDRYGPGQGGYWRYMHGSNDPLISGLPGEGGETNAGLLIAMDVGMYADVMSPWGLLDGSGGLTEWTELKGGDSRAFRGSESADQFWEYHDQVDYVGWWSALSGGRGFRIASVVPAPGPAGAVLVFLSCVFAKRRNR